MSNEDETIIYTASARRAFIVKNPGSEEKLLAGDEIMIGWSKAEGLLDEKLSRDDFREIIHKTYFPREENKRRSGQVAGDLWRFIRGIELNHFVLIPTVGGFFIGRITGPTTYDEMKIFNDTAYRRKVEWLNDKKPVPQEMTTEELQKKMKSILSVIDATVLYDEIEFALRHL